MLWWLCLPSNSYNRHTRARNPSERKREVRNEVAMKVFFFGAGSSRGTLGEKAPVAAVWVIKTNLSRIALTM